MSSSFDLKTLQNRILESLESDKEREVLFSRFGLNGRKIETLENIGNRFGVTRERIRQIEKTILKKIRNYKFLIKDFSGLYNVVTKKGGLISESRLQDAISANGENNKIILNIMLVSSANVFVINNKYFNSVWRVDTCDEDELINIAKLIVSYFKEYKKVASLKELISSNSKLSGLSQALVRAVIESCSMVGQDNDGKYGLSSWGIIQPKNTRDRSYVVLKTIKKPLHYKKLTELICSENSGNKRVSIEAVHNELIRDPRFVLVGRGIYALKEWGYNPGTVADVIEEILKDYREPMHKNDIIKKVLEKRFVRKNTILLNLQEKPQFVRVVRAVYRLKG